MIKIAILGFGTVGSGVAEVIEESKKLISEAVNDTVEIKYILDKRDFPGSPFEGKFVKDFDVIINDPEVKIVAEMLGGSHPAYDFSLAAIKAGKSVVTSNKEVVANFGDELLALAKENGVTYLFEASVGGGIPVIRPMTESLSGSGIYEIDGILNGTTNYILTQMDKTGKPFEELLREAQKNGYAEADPTADIEGMDACRKIAILAAIAFGKIVDTDIIPTKGISKITVEDMQKAKAENKTIKLIARAVLLDDGKIHMSVSPYAVNNTNPLANIDDVFNGILVRSHVTGDVMFYGRGAGKLPTAGAVLSDIINIAKRLPGKEEQRMWMRDNSVFSYCEACENSDYLGTMIK